MKKLTTLLLLLALSLCLCFSATAASAEDYTGTWILTSMESNGAAIDPTALGIEMLMTLNEDGTCLMSALGQEEAGTWVMTENGVDVTDSTSTDSFTLVDGQLVADQDEMKVVFTHEADLAGEYIAVCTNVPMEGFNGTWRLSYLEMVQGYIMQEDMGMDMTIELLDGKGWCEMTVEDTTERYDFVCELEEAPGVGTVMYATFVDAETGESLNTGLMLMLYEDNTLIWYTVEEDTEFYYCFNLETAE